MSLRAELQATLDRMARAQLAGDAAACAALFTAEAEVRSPHASPARGRAEIEALHRDWTASAPLNRFEVLDCDGSGELAWASARLSDGYATGDVASLGVVCLRGPDGGWLIRMCTLNPCAA